MLVPSLLTAALLSTTSAAFALLPLQERSSDIVCDGETAALKCYKGSDGTPQNVSTSDVEYVAAYLRAYGQQTRAGRLFTMSIANAPNCAEWTLYQHGSVLATAKHIRSDLNSSVLFTDIANTIDGGASATAAEQAKAIIGCGTAGGAEGTQYNATNPAYNTSTNPTYPAGYTPNGILIKIVSSNGQTASVAEVAS